PPPPPRFPYTTLFRSGRAGAAERRERTRGRRRAEGGARAVARAGAPRVPLRAVRRAGRRPPRGAPARRGRGPAPGRARRRGGGRSEEHTSELQSLAYL